MTTWKDIAANYKPRPITRFQRILNGERDHIHGYDDGEWPSSGRPNDYYADEPYKTGIPEVDNMNEVDLVTTLIENNIW